MDQTGIRRLFVPPQPHYHPEKNMVEGYDVTKINTPMGPTKAQIINARRQSRSDSVCSESEFAQFLKPRSASVCSENEFAPAQQTIKIGSPVSLGFMPVTHPMDKALKHEFNFQ